MWLMDERQKLMDLTTAVSLLAAKLEELKLHLSQVQQALDRRKAQQIVLEARLDRVEHGRKIASKVPVASTQEPIASEVLSVPLSSSPLSEEVLLRSSSLASSVSSASSSGDKDMP